MAVYNKFQSFSEQLIRGNQDFDLHVFKVMLTNTAPIVANQIKADITEITPGNGYVAGGTASTVTLNQSAGTTTVQGTQVVFTAAGGAIGPFRYAVLYNDTVTTPNKPLVAYWDYSSSITLQDTETLTVKFNNTSPGTILTLA